METITSRQNPLMTHIRKLAGSAAYRRQTGECLCDSPKLLREAAQWGADVRTVVSVLPWDGPLPDHVRQVLVPPEVMSSISPAKTPQGVLFIWHHSRFAGAGNASGPAICGAGRGPGPRQRGNGAADPGRL